MEKEREENICGGEKHQLVALSMAPTGYLTLQALFLRPDVVHNQHITSSKDNCSQEQTPLALAGVGQSIEHWPANQGVTRSISSLGKIPRSWARPLVEGPQ